MWCAARPLQNPACPTRHTGGWPFRRRPRAPRQTASIHPRPRPRPRPQACKIERGKALLASGANEEAAAQLEDAARRAHKAGMIVREVRALAAKASCGVSDERGRLSEALKRMKGSHEQLTELFCDRNGVPTLDVGALLAH